MSVFIVTKTGETWEVEERTGRGLRWRGWRCGAAHTSRCAPTLQALQALAEENVAQKSGCKGTVSLERARAKVRRGTPRHLK